MKKVIIPFALFLIISTISFARIIKVDINGSGQFTTIGAALNAAVNGDTIKVLPGVYDGAITISKDVVLMGSGYETTKITSNNDPTITMNGGKIIWFAITSNTGNGILCNSGIINNCVVRGCTGTGIYLSKNSPGVVSNCTIVSNVYGIWGASETKGSVFNTICYSNSKWDVGSDYGHLNINFCRYTSDYWSKGHVGNINNEPVFASNDDFHISPQSPCWNTGKPDILDPDGSPSDMGYFGGPDCPIYPVVTNVKIIPQTDGSIKIEATGVANY